MKTHSRGVVGRIISFMLVIVMIMSMWSVGILPATAADVDLSGSSADSGSDSLASTGASGISGDSTLFERADSTAPYLKVEKSSYAIDQPILVTADNGTRLGLYASSVTAPTSSNAPIYTYDLTDRGGRTFDLRTGVYNSASGVKPYLAAGTYNLFLFEDDAYTVAAQATVKITNANVNTISGTTTYLETNRKVYQYGEPIIVKANASSNANAWLGLYPTGSVNSTTPADYIVYIGSGYSTDNAGKNINLIDSSVVNTKADLEPGTYDLCLFGDKSMSNILGKVTITVAYGIINTDKTTYGYGENIISKVEAFDKDSFSINNSLILVGDGVGFRKTPGGTLIDRLDKGEGVTLVSASGGLSNSDGSNWAYISRDGSVGYTANAYLDRASGSDVKAYGEIVASSSTYRYVFSRGSTSSTYRVSPLLDRYVAFNFINNYQSSSDTKYIIGNVGGYNGYIYRGGETATAYIRVDFKPHNPANVPTIDDTNARVGMYLSSVTPASGADNAAWYRLSAFNGSAASTGDLAGGTGSYGGDDVIAAGTYNFHLFGDSSYTDIATAKEITVSEDVTGTIKNGAYQMDELSDGFANGRVALELDNTNDYGYAGYGANAVVYWADENGEPLDDYASFAKVPLDKNIVTFDMQPYSIIPEDAKGLVAYVEYNGEESTSGYVINFLEGTKTYTDLDGDYTQFNIISDTKLGSTNTTEYPNNDKHYKAALTDITNNGAESQFVFINGDVTYGGTAAQWELPESIRAEVASETGKTVPPLYIAHGNVDDNNDDVGMNGYLDFVNAHGGEVTADKPYYSFTKNGYKFIVLQSDVADKEISAEQLEWLDAELADNKENNEDKPVFIFYHYVITGTVLNETGGLNNTDDFAAVVKKYNNVFCFSGNHCASIQSHGNIFGGSDTLPVAINAGSTAKTRRYVDGAWQKYDDNTYNENSAQGFYVRVYDDKVVLLGRDFNSGKWIPEAYCVLYNQDVSLKIDEAALALDETLSLSDYINYDFSRSLYVDSSDLSIVDVKSDGTLTPLAVGDEIPTEVTISMFAEASDTRVITRLELPLRIFDTIDRNYYIYGSFDNWTDGFLMEKSLDDDDLVTATLTMKRGIYDFKLNNFETWFESTAEIDNSTDENGVVLASRKTIGSTKPDKTLNTMTLHALGGTYEFEYRISTNTLKVYHTSLVDDGGTAGDTSLLDKVASTEPYVVTSKEEFKLGESIYVTASGGTWVGIYKADTTDYENTYSSYWYYVEGCDGRPLDIRTLKYNAKDKTLDPIFYTGEYKAVLFGTNDQSQVLDEVYFDVVDANYSKDGNNILSSDKDKYFVGEPIMVTGWTDRPDLHPWVCLVPRGQTPNSNNLLYWYYVVDDNIDRRNIPCDLIKTSETNTNIPISAGEYDLWLYRTSSYGHPVVCLPITIVNGAGTVSSNKEVYGRYEDIIVTANYVNYTPGAWVGLYDESVLKGKTPTNGTGLISWYYVDDQISYTVVMQDLITNEYANTLTHAEAKAGNYSLYLFGDSGYSKIQDKASFTIEDGVTGSFSSGAYKVEKLYDGFANGQIVLELSNDSCGYIDVADATVYWADADGNPLKGYTALHKQYVNKSVITLDMNSHTIIPEGAESLVAYLTSYNGAKGTEKCVIPLPDGCLTYTGLENGILAKFNFITDTHLTSDDVAYYPNGISKYHSWQQDTSNEYFEDALKDIAAKSPDSLGIFINGDVTNNGFAEEYAQVDSIMGAVESESGVELPPVYVTMGNHDTYVGNNNNYVNFVNSHNGSVTTEAPYYSKTVGGYKFIFLAGDNSDYYGYKTAVINSGDAELSEAQLQWLDAELRDNEENNAGKPVFLFLHQAVKDTVAGSLDGQDWDGLVNVAEFKDVVEKYNNVMLMGGHSHWIIDSPQNMYAGSEDMSVAVNLGSTSYSWTDYENATEATVMESQGFFVQMYEDKVVFLGRNFTTDEWIPGACFVLYNEDVENTQTEKVELFVDETADIKELINNPLERGITYTSSDKDVLTVSEEGVVTAKKVGEAYILVNAAPTNTEVITRTKVKVKVNHYDGDPSDYYVKGGFDGWGEGLNLTHTINPNIVKGTIELGQGTYEFKINDAVNNIWYGNTGVIEDTTESTSPGLGWEMSVDEQSNCTLKAIGGTYTFSFNTETKMLIITFERASEEETGEKTATIYVDYKNSSFTETPYIYIWDPNDTSVNSNIGELWPGKRLEGPNAEGYYYRTFKYDEAYQFIINDGAGTQTADSAVHTEEELYVIFSDGVEYSEGKPPQFWIDLNPEDDSSNIDLLYPELIDGVYYFFLPSGFNARAAEFHKTEGTTLTITRIAIKDGGSTFNLLSGVNKNRSYVLGGDYSGKFMVKQSSNVASVYTYTDELVPQGTGYGDHKDDYSTSGSIMMMNSDASIRVETTGLKKLKGRGNSTWEASNEVIGKYAFNITLNEATGLIEAESQGKKYSLVSYNTDEARMRNMVVYDLAEAIGVDYIADFEPVDFYNNGRYIGSYLLTDKIEIGDPLVDITDLDEINEETSKKNGQIYDNLTDADRGYGGGTGINDTSTPGFYKYVKTLSEPEKSTYENSGFLLEFELNERFAEETSGFISERGQQIVCKYPEYATYNEMQFIMNKWAEAEDVIYDADATYEELNEVIDVESFAKMYLIQELTKNLDAGATSYFVYYDGGKLHAGVAWDYDWTLGQYTESGYPELSVANQTSGIFDSQANKLLNDPEGWWANSKEIYPATGVLNAQASLCQNETFWNVVKAEWNEIFYDTAMSFVVNRVSDVSELQSNFLEYYTQVKGTTAMDEFKWGLIESDPLESWGSADTGDTHDDATVWLNNFYYDRLQWMNAELESSDYDFAPPTLKADKNAEKGEIYSLGEEVVLTATCNSSGELTYNFYTPDGTLIESIKSSTGEAECRFKLEEEVDGNFKVIVTTEGTTSEEAQAEVKVTAQKFDFVLDVEAPDQAPAGTMVTIGATTNAGDEVLYYLYDEAGALIDANYEGIFDIETSADEASTTVKYTVKAETKINGITYTAEKAVEIELVKFEFTVSLTGPESVEAGMDIVLSANAKSTSKVTYTFYDAADHTVIGKNNLGSCIFETSKEFIGQTRSFYVVAQTEAFGKTFTSTSDVIDVRITEVTDVYNVTLYFKSTSTIGYRPMITTSGAVEDVTDKYMEKDIFICKNATETASYFWYKMDIEVSKKSPSIYFRILSSRYAMEVQGNLMITEDKTYYFAVDNLNSGTELVDLTDASEAERNWCESALHMVYDPKYDSEESLAEVTARVDLRYVGDTTADGKVNIRDATSIQKYLADLIEFGSTDKEAADVDSDYKITIKDATSIQKKLAGLL